MRVERHASFSGNGREVTALVAGGAGFLGSHLCDALLARGRRVICLDSFTTGTRANLDHLAGHPGFTLVEHDICEPVTLQGAIHEVFNLACAASPPHYQADPIHTMMTNVAGTLNLLRLAQAHGATFLQASTSEIYGDPEQHPQREDYVGHVSCTGPRACYDQGKRAAEALCFDMLRGGHVDVRVARIFNTYGPRMQPGDGRIVSNLIVQALNREALTIYGTGEQTRSFCYVSDLIAGMLALMDIGENPGMPVNLGNPQELTIKELAKLVLAQFELDLPLVFLPLPADDPKRRRPDITRAGKLLGWAPHIPINSGVARTIAYFRDILGDEQAGASAGFTGNAVQSSMTSAKSADTLIHR